MVQKHKLYSKSLKLRLYIYISNCHKAKVIYQIVEKSSLYIKSLRSSIYILHRQKNRKNIAIRLKKGHIANC